MTGSLEAKRPHADFSTALWVWYQEGSHLYKQRWSFLLSVYKSAKTVFFFFLGNLDENVTLEFSVSWSLSLNTSNPARVYLFFWYSKTAAFWKLCVRPPQQFTATVTCDRVQILPQSPSQQLKWVWSSLESERIFSRFHPASLCIWFWARRGGSGSGPAGCAGAAGGARLPQRYSLLHWDSRWIQSHCQARVGGLSP